MSRSKTIYQLKVTLIRSEPPVWRRLLVADTTTLQRLHNILQVAMGWQDYHLHMFTVDGRTFGDPEDDEDGELGTENEAGVRLSQLVRGQGFRFLYEYDFGDSWEHELIVEKILPAEPGLRVPQCTAGKRACPPEDVGGMGGYQRFREAIADPEDPEHDGYLQWVGGEFDPEHFSAEEVNAGLRYPHRRDMEADDRPAFPDVRLLAKIIPWAQGLDGGQTALAETLAVRRDMVTLLRYFQEKHPVGTQATGNLPLKAVREVCAQFTSPPEMECWIGTYHYRVRSETDVWPLFYLHRLAITGGLVTGRHGRAWRLTPAGEVFLTYSAPVQLGILLTIWWHLEDWAIAFPPGWLAYSLPHNFKESLLACLLALPVGKPVAYQQFADDLITSTGLRWPDADQAYAHRTFHTALKRMVIERLEESGCLECEFRTRTSTGLEFKDLLKIQLTDFGKGLLQTL